MTTPTATAAAKVLSRTEKKWTPALMAAGWTSFPSVILDRQKALGLDPIDINILLQLAKHWWEADSPPFPSKRTIADCIGVDRRTVQRHLAEMEKSGYIERRRRRGPNGSSGTNAYLFTGLIEKATPFAKEAVEAREERVRQKEARRRRKRVLLRPVT
jgi:DNA-binding transcriptional regulator YhcF (GntR family)